MGLINEIVEPDALMPTAMQWAKEIADNAPLAVQTTKRMMRMGLEESYDTAVDHLMVHLAGMFQSEDFKEGVQAFVEKRKPEFTADRETSFWFARSRLQRVDAGLSTSHSESSRLSLRQVDRTAYAPFLFGTRPQACSFRKMQILQCWLTSNTGWRSGWLMEIPLLRTGPRVPMTWPRIFARR